jgi:membrane fusion protein, macrolide-specific efflux system
VGSDRKPWFIRRGTIVGAAIVVVVGAGVGTWLGTRSSSAAPLITTKTTVQTVTTGTITQTVASSGTLEPASQANLDFGVSGQVTAVDVTAGQTVTAGQPLATIDPTSLNAALAQAQAELANDQSQLSTDQAAGASAAQIASDEANIASTQTTVTNAQTSLSEATLTSTIAGTVAAVNLTVGQQVDGTGSSNSTSASTGSTSAATGSTSASTGSGASSFAGSGSSASSASTAGSTSASSASTAQVVVVSTGSYLVNASVNSTQVGQLKVGDQATITVSGSTANVYGTVGSIGLLASTSSGVSSFPVVIDVTGSPSGLYGGSSATVSIITEELQDVVVVPTTAIHYSGSAITVTLDNGGAKVTQPVTIGAASGGNTQVTSGLKVGQKVYVTEVSFHGGLGTRGAAGLFGGGGAGFTGGGGFRGGGGFGGGGGVGG